MHLNNLGTSINVLPDIRFNFQTEVKVPIAI